MNSIPNPKQTNPHDVAIAARKEAYEQFGRADEELARVDELVSKLEQDAAPYPSDPQTRINTFQSGVPDDQPSLGGREIRGFIGFCWQCASVSLPSFGSRRSMAMRPGRLSRGGRRSSSQLHR